MLAGCSVLANNYFVRLNAMCKYNHMMWVIAIDRPVGTNRLDIIVQDLNSKEVWISDAACHTNVEKKEHENFSKG